MKIIAIDPGVNTGIAFYDDTPFSIRSKNILIQENKRMELSSIEERIFQLACALDTNLYFGNNVSIDAVLIESVKFWDSSSKSRVCASSGAMQLLSYLVGAYIMVLKKYYNNIRLVSPQWKGQLSNELLTARVRKFFEIKENKKISIHEICALGMIKYYLEQELG